jgi:hypothetical protein
VNTQRGVQIERGLLGDLVCAPNLLSRRPLWRVLMMKVNYSYGDTKCRLVPEFRFCPTTS